MSAANPEYIQDLRKQQTLFRRWFFIAFFAFVACMGEASRSGVADGWPWLCGALVLLSLALVARMDQKYTHMLIEIYLANAN